LAARKRVSNMSGPFDNLDFHQELDPTNWTEETRLHTPTFEALLRADGTLWLRGPALAEGFSEEAAQALRASSQNGCSCRQANHHMISRTSHPGGWMKASSDMAEFEKREFPDINRIAYEVTDDWGILHSSHHNKHMPCIPGCMASTTRFSERQRVILAMKSHSGSNFAPIVVKKASVTMTQYLT